MHDIKFIKKNPELFDSYLKKRNLEPCSKDLIEVHDKYLELLNKKQNLQEEKNILSKSFSKKEADISVIKNKVHSLKKEIDETNVLSEKKLQEFNNIMLQVPNIVLDKVPCGINENDNVILKQVGEIKKYNFKPKNHLELAESLDLIDYEKAIKISGSRFSILKKELALLYRGLINFMLDNNTNEFFYEELIVPELVKSDALIGTGQLPKFDDDLFKTTFNDLYLIPTSEVPLTNLYRESILNKNKIPLRFTTFSNCFRSEAGASGMDTKGLMREHQFGKVELVAVAEPDESMNELKHMIYCVENILNKLKLPYKIVEICSGDLGFSSSYTLDFELWMPGQNKFREVSSCSNCQEFQSRRMKMRIKNFETGEIYFPHTLNGSSLAVGRLIIAILENFQNEDGSIQIPNALENYTNGLKLISNNE